MDAATARLRKEYRNIKQNPLLKIHATPLESNILQWHYVLEGQEKSDYSGGYYHGIIEFPKEYPFKPPGIKMFTPNGRFKTYTKICMSMSDFHPESWNPMWSVGSILIGLHSFMLEEASTYGSITTTAADKRKLAGESLKHNLTDKQFCELFPHLVELYQSLEEAKKKALLDGADGNLNASDWGGQNGGTGNDSKRENGIFNMIAGGHLLRGQEEGNGWKQWQKEVVMMIILGLVGYALYNVYK